MQIYADNKDSQSQSYDLLITFFHAESSGL